MNDMTTPEPVFVAWPKTPRDKGSNVTITEKMDGTNACVIIKDGVMIGCQSRNRLIKPGDDNMGFAFWAYENKEALATLGDGYHYGEWVGPGIQKNPHMLSQKEFYLFNTFRPADTLPDCVKQVRVLYNGPYDPDVVEEVMAELWCDAAIQCYIPEGIIIYHHDSRSRTKKTFANSNGKWQAAA